MKTPKQVLTAIWSGLSASDQQEVARQIGATTATDAASDDTAAPAQEEAAPVEATAAPAVVVAADASPEVAALLAQMQSMQATIESMQAQAAAREAAQDAAATSSNETKAEAWASELVKDGIIAAYEKDAFVQVHIKLAEICASAKETGIEAASEAVTVMATNGVDEAPVALDLHAFFCAAVERRDAATGKPTVAASWTTAAATASQPLEGAVFIRTKEKTDAHVTGEAEELSSEFLSMVAALATGDGKMDSDALRKAIANQN